MQNGKFSPYWYLIGFTRTLYCLRLQVTSCVTWTDKNWLFCDTRYLLYWIATRVLCFCLISSIVLMCSFYFNMLSGSDCAVRLGRSRLARLITKSVYTGVSEWVSDTFAYPSPNNKLVSTVRVSTSLKTAYSNDWMWSIPYLRINV